jgi:sugar phosphate isomerase/epimerase
MAMYFTGFADDAAAGKGTYTFPGERQGDVRRIPADLLRRGYDGGISIEPHLAVVVHDPTVQTSAQVAFDNCVEYGRRRTRMMAEMRREAGR